MNTPSLAVVICTHNPRPAYIGEALEGLRAQTIQTSLWDLLVIDNASEPPAIAVCNLQWHPRAKVVTEDRLGVAHARRRALEETRAYDLVLFVDDDNILFPDYLAEGLRIAGDWPKLGCWGGQLLPRYEATPPPWAKNYLKYLAICQLDEPIWGNHLYNYDLVPPTAGCFMRAEVRSKYLQVVREDPSHLTLGPRGRNRIGGEDMDIMLTAIDLGMGLGRFPGLRLHHIIPSERLTEDYFASLVSGVACGQSLIEYIRFRRRPKTKERSWSTIEGILHQIRVRRLPPPIRRLHDAELSGHERAREIIKSWNGVTTGTARAPQAL